MADILYHDVEFSHAGSCKVCLSCCFMRVMKNPYDAVPLEIDWSSIPDSRIVPTDAIVSVEYAATTKCGDPVPEGECGDAIFGATHIKNATGRLGRRESSGPFSTARLWGGNDGSHYKLSMLVTYERCGHKFNQTFCVDVVTEAC